MDALVSLNLPRTVGAAGWARLPQAVQRRFAPGHPDTRFDGHLDLQCSRIGRLFAWAAKPLNSPLVGIRAARAPAVVKVYQDGCGGVVWERRLGLPDGRVQVVRSTKQPGQAEGEVVERTDGGLAMRLAVFEEGGALVFESRAYFLALGRWRVPLPMLITPGVCRVEHQDLGQGRFRFTLRMVHPWWGCTFAQTGVFTDPEEISE